MKHSDQPLLEGFKNPQSRLFENWPEDAAPPRFAFMHGGKWGVGVDDSPDPLRGYYWDSSLVDKAFAKLQCYALRPAEAVCESGEIHSLEMLLEPDSIFRLETACCIRFDFGLESAGWLEFESDDLCGEVELSISEYNRPGVVNCGAQHPVKTAKPIRDGKTWRLVLNDLLYEGVRFAWLTLHTCPKPWTLSNLRLVCQVKPSNYLGSFKSSDAELNRIWEVGAYSAKLNLLEDHFGAILMERSDRHSWTGDAYVSQAVSMAAFGNFALVRENLVRMEDDDNGIEAFSLYWILAACDYTMRSGDVEYLDASSSLIEAKLRRAEAVISEKKQLNFFGHDDRLGACFEEPDKDANRAHFAAFALRTIRRLSELPEAERYDEAFADLRSAALDVLYTVDWAHASLHLGVEGILAGLFSPSTQRTQFVANEFCELSRAWSYSPFNGYSVLLAMAESGAMAEACALLKYGWGGMLKLGATTFWESFRPEWGAFMRPNDPPPNGMHGYTSLCHPWSGGPTAWLSDFVLGVEASTPGYKTIRVAESMPTVVEKVQGSIPTPWGLIQIERNAEGGKIILPDGIQGLTDTGRILSAGRNQVGASPLAQALQKPVVTYPLQWLKPQRGIPSINKKNGWISFCSRLNGGDLSMLPEGMSVSIATDRLVAVPRREVFSPAVITSQQNQLPVGGALRTQVPGICRQTFTVDVLGDFSAIEEIGIFCLDQGQEGIQQTVELFDLETGNLLVPTHRIYRFEDGVCLRVRPKCSFRIRIAHCYGSDATLSGILFK